MPDIKLFLLGPPRIECDGSPIEVDTRKAVALLAYLAITREHKSRDALAGLLWPEYGPGRARAALRRTLSTLSEARKEGWLVADRANVGLVAGGVWVDVDRFYELLTVCRSHGHPETEVCPACLPPLTKAVALYRDDFLAGFGLRDSFSFYDWQHFQSEDLRREFAGALDRLVCGHGGREEWGPAIGYARRRLALDPLHEPTHRSLMRLYALSGQRSTSLRQYRECVRLLKKELGVAPLEETNQLYRTVQEEGTPPFAPLAATAPEKMSPDSPATHEASPAPQPPKNLLVGRAEEWQVLQREHEAASSGGRFVVLQGEAGIGKTRLAEEFTTRVVAEGATVLTARCYAGEANLAYSPFVEALEAVVDRPDVAARLQDVPARLLSEASRLLPALADLVPGLPAPPPFDTPGAQSRFFEGVTRTLVAACGAEPNMPPGILLLDDLQWADDASLDLLSYLMRRLSSNPVLILALWREEEVPENHRLRRLILEAQRMGTVTVLRLRRLDPSGVMELVSSVIGKSNELGQRLYEETEGLPLFLVEYLIAISKGTLPAEGESWALPGGVRDLLHERLRRLSETGGQVLTSAAVIGRSFDFGTVWQASGRSEEEAITALEELISQSMIRELAGDSSGNSPIYDFSHDKIRALLYEETSLARKRLLHLRVAETLAARARGHLQETGPLAYQIAHHYSLAGRDAEAANYYRLAGEHARTLYANTEALSHFQTALALGHPDVAGLYEAIADLQTLEGDYSAAVASYETAAALRKGLPLAAVERKLGNIYQRQGEWNLAESYYESALEQLGESGPAAERARLYADRSLLSHRQVQTGEAIDLARQALELAEAAGDAPALARTHNLLGMLANSSGDQATARRHLKHSLSLSETLDNPSIRIAALNNLARAHAASGETKQAIQAGQAALDLCGSIGDRHHEAALYNNLADILHASGQHKEAISYLKKAVVLFAEIGEEGGMQPEIWKLAEW